LKKKERKEKKNKTWYKTLLIKNAMIKNPENFYEYNANVYRYGKVGSLTYDVNGHVLNLFQIKIRLTS